MRKFRATTLQDNSLAWQTWDDLGQTKKRDEVWGVSLVPWPVYSSYDDNDNGIGDVLYYEWYALLDPDIALPNWITEITE